MIQKVRSLMQARIDAVRDREATLRRIAKTTLVRTKRGHGVHLACLASLFSRIMGVTVHSAETLAAVTAEFPNAIYCFRKRHAQHPKLTLRVVCGVKVRTSLTKLCEIIQGNVDAVSRPNWRHQRKFYSESFEGRIGLYRRTCDWSKYPPIHKIIFEDWATTRRRVQVLAAVHGMQDDRVKSILSHHRARAGVL